MHNILLLSGISILVGNFHVIHCCETFRFYAGFSSDSQLVLMSSIESFLTYYTSNYRLLADVSSVHVYSYKLIHKAVSDTCRKQIHSHSVSNTNFYFPVSRTRLFQFRLNMSNFVLTTDLY